MDIVMPQIEDYLVRLTPARQDVLSEMEQLARQRGFPIVGPLVGRILYQYAKLTAPLRILELGSGYGYSAFWWALGSPAAARIYCTEGSPDNIRKGKEFLGRASLLFKIEYLQGNALETMDQVEGELDIIFRDIDKRGYPEGFRKGFPRLRKGGLFVTDNVLWRGRVVENDGSRDTAGVLEYNELIYNTPGAFSTILPVRDGVAVTYKES